jgi:hypothetical protein
VATKKIASQLSPRVVAARKNGALGGKARAAKYKGTKKLEQWAATGGKQTLALYGNEFFAHAVSLTKVVGRYRTPRKAEK